MREFLKSLIIMGAIATLATVGATIGSIPRSRGAHRAARAARLKAPAANPTKEALMPIELGKKAPLFSLPSTTGEIISLQWFQGKKAVVLYFYPKDFTPGCTQEACDFRDSLKEFEKAGVVVLGVSPDSIASHEKFAANNQLPFLLLSDPGHKVIQSYGAWGEKTVGGKTSEGVIRSTVLIDRNGKVAGHWPNVTVKGHVQEVLKAAEAK